MSYRTGDTTTGTTALTRTLRRTAIAGAGVAMIFGLAGPAHAASADSAAKPTSTSVVATTAANTTTTTTAATTPAPAGHAAAPAPVHSKPMPSMRALETHGKPAHQVSLKPNKAQRANAEAIIKAGQHLKLPPRAWVIALATSMQETHLHNYGNLGNQNDHDSLGLFQQRPSAGWGSARQIVKPAYAATKFYKALVQVKHWNKLPLTVAAQKVQVSAFGDRYAKWESQAAHLVMDHFKHAAK